MKAVELPKSFNPADFEKSIYDFWMNKNLFIPVDNGREPFVIVIPPPNVTGILHLGHGLNNVLQDVLIRYYRMLGRPTLWVPGTDHAGIATQNVVEKMLKQKGTSRRELGREKFLEETWKVKEKHHKTIIEQLKKIGASCDWSRERFTLDEGLSRAVREVFVSLYERGLIYRDNYLINWCSNCGTAISDDEVEHYEIPGKLYHYYYPMADGSGKIEIATTRPETMLGDTAVAVHPDDRRYKNLAGRMVNLPLTGRAIPIVEDSYVNMEFGTGAVKVTPAHDQNDWEIAERHGLPKINILNPDGTLNENVPEKYRGLDVITARRRVVEDLKSDGLFIKEEDHPHQVGHCYRCNTLIEPYLSTQWFVRMKPLAEKALKVLRDGEIVFYPRKWENTYTHWLVNIKDWCISRQLWWGHRIPVWYCENCGKMTVAREDPSACSHCGGNNIRQDEDVLDTWFSSWLWPFSTLGWPDETEDLKKYFPTSALVTGYEIIFFWVARMIMAGMEFMGKAPFRDIYIHGIVRDKLGRKMSKSLGNGIDPLEIVDEFGADALKFTLVFLAAQGQDILLDKEDFRFGSKFANKIWNASRYLLMNLEGRTLLSLEEIEPEEIDRWIFHRLNEAVKRVRRGVESYRFNDAAQAVYEYFWNDFCDWYIEASKLELYSEDENRKNRAVTLLMYLLEESLRLLHPFLSFITEEIYQKLPLHEETIVTAPFPEPREDREHGEIADQFASLQELTVAVRTLRSEFTIPPSKKIKVRVKTEKDFEAKEFIKRHTDLIRLLINASELIISDEEKLTDGCIPVVGRGFEAYVHIKELIDVPREVEKLKREISNSEKEIARIQKKLLSPSFSEKAPAEVVERQRRILSEFLDKKEKLKKHVEDLQRSL
ncbi:MAG: valine--tRNA ligase [Spirochaetes bacterium]|nr:MAG: valine--tRNA ligase [Spirochaetota bacterium]